EKAISPPPLLFGGGGANTRSREAHSTRARVYVRRRRAARAITSARTARRCGVAHDEREERSLVSRHQLERPHHLSGRERRLSAATAQARSGRHRVRRRAGRPAQVRLAGGSKIARCGPLGTKVEELSLSPSALCCPHAIPPAAGEGTNSSVRQLSTVDRALTRFAECPVYPFNKRSSRGGREIRMNKTSRGSVLVAAAVLAACAAPRETQQADPSPPSAEVKASKERDALAREEAIRDAALHRRMAATHRAERETSIATRTAHPVPAPFIGPCCPSVLPPQANTERYQHLDDNPVKLAAEHPVSTFSIDVDTGAYANVRRFLNAGQL